MTRHLLTLLTGCSLVVTGSVIPRAAVAADPGKVEQDLMQLERNWCTALVNNDAAALDAILADDLVDVSHSGAISDKADDLASVKKDKTNVCEDDLMHVRVYGDTAVVVGRMTYKSVGYSGLLRFTDTYVRRNGRWQCVSTSAAEIK